MIKKSIELWQSRVNEYRASKRLQNNGLNGKGGSNNED